MLLRHSIYYLIARGLPGIVSFAALVLYTRLITVEEFGRYSLVLAGVGLAHVAVFQWLQLVLARFLPAHRESPPEILAAVLSLFFVIAAASGAIGLVLALLWPEPTWRGLIALAVPLIVAQAWLQLNLSLASAELAPARYGRLLGGKSVIALAIGGSLAWLGFGSRAPLVGLLIASVLAWLLFGLRSWRGVRVRWPAPEVLREYAAYGLPLMATFALGWIISSSDRFLIAWFMNEAATGVYSVGYDLAQQTLGFALAIINTAAYPLALRQLARDGEAAATIQLNRNGDLIFSFALAGAAGLIALSPLIVDIFVGQAFREGAREVLPWIAAAAAVAGIKAFHLDLAFQMARRSRWQAITSVVAAAANIALNVLLIPRYGILGAAWATLAAFLLAAALSGWIGTHTFPMPAFMPLLIRGVSVAGLFYLGTRLSVLADRPSWAVLFLGIAGGGSCALAGALLLDVAGSRKTFCAWLSRLTNWPERRA
jgi:O-antigen/teichoic acid export membrane protein